MRIKITVTKTGIKLGEPYNVNACPIARAFHRAGIYGEAHRYSFTTYSHEKIPFSKRVKRFISRFDSHKPVKPFSFYIEKP